MSQAKYIKIEDATFGGDLGSKDLSLSASGNQWVTISLTKQEAIKVQSLLLEAILNWDSE